MSKFRLGLPTGLISHASVDSESISETIEKAHQGFGRGPKAGHKYWRRVRVMRRGKLAWDYYYNTPEDRKHYLEDQAKRIKTLKGKVAKTRAKIEGKGEHKNKGSFQTQFDELSNQRRALKALTEDYVSGFLTWDKPPEITLSPLVESTYKTAVEDHYDKRNGEPDDLHGHQLHALRALDIAFNLMPQVIKDHWSGSIREIVLTTGDEDKHIKKRGAAGLCRAGFDGRSTIFIDCQASRFSNPETGKRQYGWKGGLIGAKVVVHEIAHAIHNKMGAHGPNMMGPDYTGPNWEDWKAHVKKIKGSEDGITKYAETNEYERWAESFACALMYPWQLAHTCPRTYDWFRNFFGEDAMMSRERDDERIVALEAELEKATTLDEQERIRKLISFNEGIVNIANPEEDERLQWWNTKKEQPLQRLLKNRPGMEVAPSDVYTLDPPDWDKIGKQEGRHDRFYEMSYRSRSLFFRIGPQAPGEDFSDWEPSSVDGMQRTPRANEIKEVFDENGNPVDKNIAMIHLIQDVIEDENHVLAMVKVGDKKVPCTVKHLIDTNMSVGDPIVDAFIGSGGSRTLVKALRSLSKPKFATDLVKLQKLQQEHATASGKAKEKLEKKIAHLERLLDHSDWATDVSGAWGGMPLPATIVPHEITGRTYKNRSGSFAYDRIQMAGQHIMDELKSSKVKPGSPRHTALLDELRKYQPGVQLENRRWPKGSKIKDPKTGKMINVGGRFRRGNVVVDKDGVPVFDSIKYENENPDGTKTVIKTKRDISGQFRITNPMWNRLLTPHGEDVRSAAHLEELCRIATRAKASTWVSLRTDRKRYKDSKGRWKMEKAGDTGRHHHFQVTFDGAGQPRILGKEWARKLGTDAPRIDQLLSKDEMFKDIKGVDRSIIPAEQVTMRPAEQFDKNSMPKVMQRVILTVAGEEQRAASAKEKDVVVRLRRVIPGKKAGDPPPEPGWDRMPENSLPLEQEFPVGTPGRVSPHERKLIERGILPAWWTATKLQKKWYNEQYKPARDNWKATFDEEKAKAYETVFEFVGEVGGGAPGRVFRRSGEDEVKKTFSWPKVTDVPDALENDVLGYLHQDVDPRSGRVVNTEMRLKMPRNGRITADTLGAMPGVNVLFDRQTGAVDSVQVNLDAFEGIRKSLSGLSLTDGADRLLKDRIDMLVAAQKASEDESHQMDISEIDPAWLIDNWEVGLQRQLPTGQKFELGFHQKELLQKLIDNDGRVLAAHYMGTGKTVSAITAAKLMMARPYRDTPPDDLRGAELDAWLEDHPWDTSKLHPDNPKRVMIVAPLNTVEQWRGASEDFDDGALVVGSGSNDIPIEAFVKGIKDGTYKPDMVVCGPEYWTLHADKLKTCGFDGLVIDEVHMGIKNEKAERNGKVREWNGDMKMLMLLTGTPMTTSPTDLVEYIRLLSNGKEWADMTAKKFTEEYLEPSPIPEELGAISGRKGPKLQVKAHKRAELAAILGRWMDIALQKDVRGKTLPAVRIEDNKYAHMSGHQAELYNLFMATLGASGAGALTPEEAARAGDPAVRRASAAARAVVNNVGYKPNEQNPYLQVTTVTYSKTGKEQKSRADFRTFKPDYLVSKARGKNSGKWPSLQEIGPEAIQIYNLFCQDVLGLPYEELAGKPIGYGIALKGVKDPFKVRGASDPIAKKQKAAALKRMRDAGWPDKVKNPNAGPLGVRFRGSSISWKEDLQNKIDAAEKRGDNTTADRLKAEMMTREGHLSRATEFQRAVRDELLHNPPGSDGPAENYQDSTWLLSLANVAADFGISVAEGQELMNVHPNPSVTESEFSYYDPDFKKTITLKTNVDGDYSKGDWWVSDKKGSLHLPYRNEDCDNTGAPKSTGGFEAVEDGRIVALDPAGLKAVGITPPKMPRGLSKEEKARWKETMQDWAPPPFRYDASIPEKGDNVGLINTETGSIVYAPKSSISAVAKNLMDPGMREERLKWDISMTHQNAKSEALRLHIERFHADGGKPGPDGERQMVLFGNGILDSCRTMEATLRRMGFRDVNEVIEGSPHFDPDDPTTKDGTSPNQKYFVTYIGSTYTGNREINVSIFQKVKDKLNRDGKESLFVHKCMKGKSPQTFITDRVKDEDGNEQVVKIKVPWALYPGDFSDDHLVDGASSISMSQWSADQREVIKQQFGIKPPESFVTMDNGNGTETQGYFYGTKRSGEILREIAIIGNPTKMSPEGAAKAKLKLAALKAEYSAIAHANATTDPPISEKQQNVFNNCEAIVCSDAAQVGMNLGNAVEMVPYDSLGSPMAEAQRITRCARMLPPAVSEALIGKPILEPKMTYDRDSETGDLIMVTNPDDPSGPKVPKMIEKKMTNPDTGKLETVMVHKLDELGRPMYDSSGPFSKIREMEQELFDPQDRERPVGTIEGLSLPQEFQGGTPRMALQTFGKALEMIQAKARASQGEWENQARLLASQKKSAKAKAAQKVADQWRSIANKSAVAGNLGPVASREVLLEFKNTKTPGGSENLISFPEGGISPVDVESGTYDQIDVNGVEDKIRKAIDRLDPDEQKAILNAGFIQADGPYAGSHDAASVYMAIRAQEILTWIEDNREEVATEMRSGSGGAVVTDNDILNTLIDRLSPNDRAILKTKKYLVNVRKLAASADVGQVHIHKYKVAPGGQLPPGHPEGDFNTTGKPVWVRETVFTGYERENPVGTEVKRRAMARARQISLEHILSSVQNGVEFRPEGEFEQVTSAEMATASMLPEETAVKSMVLVFNMTELGRRQWEAEM